MRQRRKVIFLLQRLRVAGGGRAYHILVEILIICLQLFYLLIDFIQTWLKMFISNAPAS